MTICAMYQQKSGVARTSKNWTLRKKRRATRLRQDILQAYRNGDENGIEDRLARRRWPEDSTEFGAL